MFKRVSAEICFLNQWILPRSRSQGTWNFGTLHCSYTLHFQHGGSKYVHIRMLLHITQSQFKYADHVLTGRRNTKSHTMKLHEYCHTITVSTPTTSGGSKKFERGGGGRRRISPVVIYRKCTQRIMCLLHGKRWIFEKNSEPIRGAASTALRPLNPPLPTTHALKCQ